MQPIQNATPRPPGEPPSPIKSAGELPLSAVQRTLLERLITRIVALNQQQPTDIWAGLKHDLKLKGDAPLLSKHFPAAEQNLNQRLTQVQNTQATRQTIQQLTALLPQSNNRQVVSDFIRQQFGQTALSQLTPAQLKTVLVLLQNNQPGSALPPHQAVPFQEPTALERPLQPVEKNILNHLVSKLATSTGESGKQIWQNLLEQVSLKPGEPIPGKLFAPLSNFLQAQHILSQHPAPTLESVQTALNPPLTEQEREWIADYSQQRFQATPQTLLTPLQVQDLLTQILLNRTERQPGVIEVRDIKPIISPFWAGAIESIQNISTRSSIAIIALVVAILALWIVF
ncbi:flagella biosynthesis regulator Flk [uncultured Cedecea sp.]|uniref:flagella biosynthesis regulator Flk n=1 Tax=uncultured Cedecea sp. TaxID=988762 RepID=UPI002636D3E0|nr:flagella biosynthesis regulator Flk [uncultured Cedecea sp.]